jgi:hypothetical protein
MLSLVRTVANLERIKTGSWSFVLPHDEHRTGGVRKQMLRRAAEHESADRSKPAGSYHHDVNPGSANDFENLLRGVPDGDDWFFAVENGGQCAAQILQTLADLLLLLLRLLEVAHSQRVNLLLVKFSFQPFGDVSNQRRLDDCYHTAHCAGRPGKAVDYLACMPAGRRAIAREQYAQMISPAFLTWQTGY